MGVGGSFGAIYMANLIAFRTQIIQQNQGQMHEQEYTHRWSPLSMTMFSTLRFLMSSKTHAYWRTAHKTQPLLVTTYTLLA
jgi:hypothetical protein